jgi:hypothetical protein
VRQAVLGAISPRLDAGIHTSTSTSGRRPAGRPGALRRVDHPYLRALRLSAAGVLLRFDLTPRRIALAAGTCLSAMLVLAYWFNLLPPLWGYNKLGFEFPGEDNPAAVNATPLPAVSTDLSSAGWMLAAPNAVHLSPAHDARGVAVNSTISIRFDQPMDRSSVEQALLVNPPIAGTFIWEADNEVRFSPASPGLLRGVTYTVELSNTARSLAGTPLAEPISWSFRTTEPYSVSAAPDTPSGATLSPTGTITLVFDVPMDAVDTASKVWLLSANEGGASALAHTTSTSTGDEPGAEWRLPASLSWSADGRILSLTPTKPLPEGEITVGVASTARTRSGDTLGRAAEFTYTIALPTPRLRLTGDRVLVAPAMKPVTVQYEAVPAPSMAPEPDAQTAPRPAASIYRFPAEWLSELGAQARPWPLPLPEGLISALAGVQNMQGSPAHGEPDDPATIPGLPAGLYLLVIRLSSPAGELSDWQLLVVADSHLAQTEKGGSFWATDRSGRPWTGAEVSLYSPQGTLLDKGLTDQRGLWRPSGAGAGATLAIARDVDGHLAALVLQPGAVSPLADSSSGMLAASMHTDLPAYRPGQQVNFRVLIHSRIGAAWERADSTPVAEQNVVVSLLTPTGSTVGRLTLRPDGASGVTGVFTLSPELRPGRYTVRVQAGKAYRDFPLSINPADSNTLSVYALPSNEYSEQTITHTVSVLGPDGRPASGAVITGTLRISGEPEVWTSQPITAKADTDGRATLTVRLPEWFAYFNEPGLYLAVEARLHEYSGTYARYLDRTSFNSARSGMRQLVSPSLDFAAVAVPQEDGSTRLRVVSLKATQAGDLLVVANGSNGRSEAWSLDLKGKPDITITLAEDYAGGRLRFLRAGLPGWRELQLMPGHNPAVSLQVTASRTVAPGAPLQVNLRLLDVEGQGVAGIGTVWFRRVADMASSDGVRAWEPGVSISAAEPASTTPTAPASPGLWYVMAEAATYDATPVRSWAVVEVVPGVSLQLPPAQRTNALQPLAVSVMVHNPTGERISSGVRVVATGNLKVSGGGSQAVDVAPGGRQRLDWQLVATRPGPAVARFFFMPSAGVSEVWTLEVLADENPRTVTTYASGVLAGERTIGVQVPSGLSDDAVELEIRVSTSLLSMLSGIVSDLPAVYTKPGERVALAATRLSSTSSVAAAYRRLGYGDPELEPSSVQHSLVLQQLYSAQNADGGWGKGADGFGNSQVADTAHALLAMRRHSIAWLDAGGEPQPAVDPVVVNRGLAYLYMQLLRPPGPQEGEASLEERTYGLYVLALYGKLEPELARQYVAYAAPHRQDLKLSAAAQAWLALALWQSGSVSDALALANRLLAAQPDEQVGALAPMLELLVMASNAGTPDAYYAQGTLDRGKYRAAAAQYATLLVEARRGVGWSDPVHTANAVWALSRYAEETEEEVQSGVPLIDLNDHPVQVLGRRDNRGAVSLAVSVPGHALRAGNNRLELKPTAGQTVYYSLTLRATR